MSSHASSYYPGKGAYAPRPATGSATAISYYSQCDQSLRSYGGRPKATVVVRKPSGPIDDPNTSTSAGNSGYHR